jgi:hypothetical protein
LCSGIARASLRLPVLDSQCGFKMLRRAAGLRLFALCREPGYLFDLELLAWAQRLGYRLADVPVAWREVPGSKVRLLADGWNMVRGVWNLSVPPAGGRPAACACLPPTDAGMIFRPCRES